MSLTLAVLCTVAVNAQNVKGDWYVGTGDIANTAWTEWSIAPTLGYAISDKFNCLDGYVGFCSTTSRQEQLQSFNL